MEKAMVVGTTNMDRERLFVLYQPIVKKDLSTKKRYD
jgi:hypothetical protein